MVKLVAPRVRRATENFMLASVMCIEREDRSMYSKCHVVTKEDDWIRICYKYFPEKNSPATLAMKVSLRGSDLEVLYSVNFRGVLTESVRYVIAILGQGLG